MRLIERYSVYNLTHRAGAPRRRAALQLRPPSSEATRAALGTGRGRGRTGRGLGAPARALHPQREPLLRWRREEASPAA